MQISKISGLTGYTRAVNCLTVTLTWDDLKTKILSLKAGSLKELSYWILDLAKADKAMAKEQNGDSASNNFALNVFEGALDWEIGITLFNMLRTFTAQKKRGETVKVIVVMHNTKSSRKSVFCEVTSARGTSIIYPFAN